MTTTTTPHQAVVALPPKAVTAQDWQPDDADGRFYRIFEGEERQVGESIRVWTHGCQYDDGHIDDGTAGSPPSEAPGLSVDGVYWEKSLNSATARQLADLLVTAADEIDGWVQR
jgi:hypothetical protein